MSTLTPEDIRRVAEAQKELTEGNKPFGPDNPDNVAKRDDRPPWERWRRKVRIWDKEIPINDGRLQTTFRTSERCGVEDKGGKCQLLLLAARAVNYKPDWDENHIGLTLSYNFNDTRYYIFCYKHGPFPAGPEHWDSDEKK